MIKIFVSGTSAKASIREQDKLTAGSKGHTVKIDFGPDWANLVKTVNVQGSGAAKDTLLASDDTFVLPYECITTAGGRCKVGIVGVQYDEDEETVLKAVTVYADLGIILQGAAVSGSNSQAATLELWEQVQTALNNEISNRTSAVTAEATARQSADSQLTASVLSEASARSAADTAEATARAAEDSNLQNQINGKAASNHNHDGVYQAAGNYAAANHNHAGVYQPAGSYAAEDHTHAGVYQPVGSYAASNHNHSGVYQPVGNYANASDIPSDAHIIDLIEEHGGGGGTGAVSSVNGQTGAVSLDYEDVGAAAEEHTHAWSDITGKPYTFTPSAHNHSVSDVTNLNTLLSYKQDKLTAGEGLTIDTGSVISVDNPITNVDAESITYDELFGLDAGVYKNIGGGITIPAVDEETGSESDFYVPYGSIFDVEHYEDGEDVYDYITVGADSVYMYNGECYLYGYATSKQSRLTAGDGISIEDGVISATSSGGGGDFDTVIDVTNTSDDSNITVTLTSTMVSKIQNAKELWLLIDIVPTSDTSKTSRGTMTAGIKRGAYNWFRFFYNLNCIPTYSQNASSIAAYCKRTGQYLKNGSNNVEVVEVRYGSTNSTNWSLSTSSADKFDIIPTEYNSMSKDFSNVYFTVSTKVGSGSRFRLLVR